MGGLFRTVSHVLARLFALIPICVFFAHKSGPLFLPLLSRNKKKFFWKNFFRNMSGPPRAGHIWTNLGAWFFHLQFYKKYVIIFKKSKISHENFSHEHFIVREMFITIEWKLDLLSRYFFDSPRQNFFWKLRTKIFFESCKQN